MNIITKYILKTLELFVGIKTAVQQLLSLSNCENLNRTFLIWGEPGIGKTTLTRLIASELMDQEVSGNETSPVVNTKVGG